MFSTYPTSYSDALPVGQMTRTPGRRKIGRPYKDGDPLVDRSVGFEPEVEATIEAMAKEEKISFPEFVRRAVAEKLNPQPIHVVANADTESVPLLDFRVACGNPSEASDSARPFLITRDVADEIGYSENDFSTRARGESMEAAGIRDEMIVLMRPLKSGRLPRRDEIALVRFTKEGEEPTGTIKYWNGTDSDGRPKLLDGEGNEFPIPDGCFAEPIAIAKAVLGELN